MEANGQDEIEVPVLRLHPLPGEDDGFDSGKTSPRRRPTTAFSRFRRSSSFKSDGVAPSQSPGRLIFPGQPRPKSAACVLRELQTPTRGRQRNSIRQDPESEGLKHLPDAPRKVSHDELETIVSRLQRQTNSGRARTALTRRINQQKQDYTKPVQVNYVSFEPVRFRGLRKVSKDELDSIVLRLSSYEKDRQPAESERHSISKENHKKLGVLNSYRWKGLRNC